ncbi:probable enoyl-CoA hydratase 2, mitochondrial isoform X2 [Camellia sinensis]|uniref:probable enoyl-CoA hydratase 2, mitochondrial isoform X2 n=1 Tax=Camellia sinensis TaxID=4442 RepID=UPI0010356D71|nr:probable enoyl-CoA hydratase 2, mitochondrial isoform X2 [Camellia sinensis]
MATLSTLGASIGRKSVGISKPYFSQLFNSNSIPCTLNSPQWQYQSLRTLLLDRISDCVKLHRHSDSDSGIIEVKLDRPGAKNSIGKDMLRGLQHSFEAINRDSSANILMISSSVPRMFCAGADLKERKTMSSSEVQAFVNSLRSTFSYLEALHIPTIAVIEGAALGGGLEMVLSCDLRICGEDAVLGLPETGLAIIPGAGGTQRLPRLVGISVAKELIFCGRKVGGRDAVSMGLVNHCVPAGEAHLKALEIARNINQKLSFTCQTLRSGSIHCIPCKTKTAPMSKSISDKPCVGLGPLALRMAKRAINEGLEVDMASALALEEECYEQLLNTKDRLEGLEAFAEKRTPKYTGE